MMETVQPNCLKSEHDAIATRSSVVLTPILERRSVRSDAAMPATMSSRTPAPNSRAMGIARPLLSLPCLSVRRCVGVAGGVDAS